MTGSARAASGRFEIDINADAGEGFDSPELFSAVSSVNIACGGHAGDAASMRAAVALARACDAAVGAHPGYEDRARFGRVETGDSPRALGETVRRQMLRLAEIGVPITHVKPHGALYHRVATDADAARAVVEAIAALDPGISVVGFPDSELLRAAQAVGLPAVAEGFADRRYGADGRLVGRDAAGALLSPPEALAQALQLATEARIATICLHSDSPGAGDVAAALRRGLEASGWVVAPFATRLPSDASHGSRLSTDR
ncbi:MAG: LamB/YcsF family protein [Thermoanaerobaculia bacterium]